MPDRPANELYERAQTLLAAGDFYKAVTILEALDTRYPFGPYATQVQLDLIYVYYKSNEPAKGLANIDRFLRLNPTHPQLDYVLYMRGLTSEIGTQNFFQSLFNIDRSDRDPAPVQSAFNDYKQLVSRFPNSDYAADARARMVKLKQQLAAHELAAAHYYIKREAYLAAVNRGKYIIEHYPDTPAAKEALKVMSRGYRELKLDQLAKRCDEVYQYNQALSASQ